MPQGRAILPTRWQAATEYRVWAMMVKSRLSRSSRLITPTPTAQSMPAGSHQVRQLSFLTKLPRPLSLAWNQKLAEVRQAIAN